MRIAVLDDDPVQADFVRDTMSSVGHVCQEFHQGRELLDQFRHQTFDPLVLDWLVPDVSGEHVLLWVRKNLPGRVPVIFMTARGMESDIVSILNVGVDDYIVKPVSSSTFLARVNAVLRHAFQPAPKANSEVFGEFKFDLASGQVPHRGSGVPSGRAGVLKALRRLGYARFPFFELTSPVATMVRTASAAGSLCRIAIEMLLRLTASNQCERVLRQGKLFHAF